MKHLLALGAASLFLLTGCSGSPLDVVHSASKPSPAPVVASHRCADLVAQALASPDAPVAGVMECFAPSVVDALNQNGIFDAADFQQQIVKSPPTFNSATYCGIAHNGSYVYAMASSDGQVTGRYALGEDKQGEVDNVGASDGKGCPQGLR